MLKLRVHHMNSTGKGKESNTGKGKEQPFRSSHPNWEDTTDRHETKGQKAAYHHQACFDGKWILRAKTKSFLSYAQSLRLSVFIYKMGTCFVSTSHDCLADQNRIQESTTMPQGTV